MVMLLNSSALLAFVRLPSIFSDNMVLQQGMPVRIWGWADPGEKINLSFSEQWKTAVTNEEGKWSVLLDELNYGGPYEMIITGENEIILHNILVGEVWVSSGQSNMEWPLSLTQNAEQELLLSNYPKIRLFKVRRKAASEPSDDCIGNWDICEPVTVSGFSAVAYFFGTELYNKLNVPVGLIDASWGGSVAEAWMEMDVLKAHNEYKPIIQKWDECLEKYGSMEKMIREWSVYEDTIFDWVRVVSEAAKNGQEIPEQPVMPECSECLFFPSGMYNGMINPLIPFGIRGVIWYQGESNAARALQYQKLFPALIDNWRTAWGQGDFQFLFVQIAPFGAGFYEEDEAAELREAQFLTYLNVPNTGMVVTMDIGNVTDIHPRNKKEVGRRLALWALSGTYNQEGGIYSGPLYKSMSIEKNEIRVCFDFTGSGLMAENGKPRGFEIAGKDMEFVEADCEIQGDCVIVISKAIDRPVAVRYGWGNDALPKLFNKEGLPASPFNTENWPERIKQEE